jgi:hypothetical protein
MFNFDVHQYEDLIDLEIPINDQELDKVDYNWVQYNPRKPISRWGCSITSLNGSDAGVPDLDSLLEYNKLNYTSYAEKDFNIRTEHSKPFDYFLSNFEVGRSHYIKLGAGGFFPWHRDSDSGSFRVIYTVKNCNWSNFVWLEENKVLPLTDKRWYYINTRKRHSVFSFSESIFAVFNVLNTPKNIKKLKNHFFIK